MSVGLDIGSTTIKITELVEDHGKWRLKASGIVGFKGTPIERIKDDKEVALLSEAIKKLHKEAKVSSKEVIISLPESQVFTRTVKFPLLTETEIASAVKWEAEQYIPIPIAEAIVQHKILEKREDLTPPSTVVLLVAAPRVLIEKYVKVVEKAGLKVSAVETELMALARSLTNGEQSMVLADFGARSTDIAIIKSGNLAFSRSISTGGEAFTRAVSQALGIESAQAEEYKITYGFAKNQLEGKITSSLDPVIRLIGDEIKKAIHFYKIDSRGDTPNSIVLAGGTAGMPGITTTFSKVLGMEVVLGNPFSKISLDAEVAKSLAGYAPLYAVSVGLAMRSDV